MEPIHIGVFKSFYVHGLVYRFGKGAGASQLFLVPRFFKWFTLVHFLLL